MVTRLRTKKSRPGTKQRLVAMEQKVEKAAKKAVKTVRGSLAEVRTNKKLVAVERKVGQAAKKAGRTLMHASLSDAVAAVRRAAKKVARRVSKARPPAKRTARKAGRRTKA